MALHGQTVYDERTAKVANGNPTDYLVPVNADAHDAEIVFVSEKDTNVNPLGVKRTGELGITGMPAVISSATYYPTGKRLRDLPITTDQVLP